jgi:TetR/AcrR family transcriptional regulator
MPALPASADPTRRDQILDAAERLFAAQGFARTTIKQIGRDAGVNSALLYYYFTDKDQLYREVLQRFVARLVSLTMQGSAGAAPPDARLRAFVEAQAETLVEHPHAPRLLVREMIDYDAAHAVEQIQHLSVTGFRRLCELIEEGQRAGLFRADVDPRFAAISTIAQVAYFLVARPAVRILLGQGAEGPSPEVVRAFGRHAADFAVAALAAPAVRRSPRRRAARSRRRPA